MCVQLSRRAYLEQVRGETDSQNVEQVFRDNKATEQAMGLLFVGFGFWSEKHTQKKRTSFLFRSLLLLHFSQKATYVNAIVF